MDCGAYFSRVTPIIPVQDRVGVYRPSEELARAGPDLIFRLDRNGVFLDYVPARALDTVVPADEFLGRNVAEILPHIAPDAMRCAAAALDFGQRQAQSEKKLGRQARRERFEVGLLFQHSRERFRAT